MTHTFICRQCNHFLTHKSDCSTGYALDLHNNKICFSCCASLDKGDLMRDGHNRAVPLYLTEQNEVTNWPGTLRFRIAFLWHGPHNIGGRATYFRFIGPDKKVWSGKQIGSSNTLCRVRRTKLKTLCS